MRLLGIVAAILAAAGLLSSLSGTQAAAPVTWTRFSDNSAHGQLGALRVGKNVVVAWARTRSGKADLMSTTFDATGKNTGTTPIVVGWNGIGDAALVPTKSGGVRVFFEGIRSGMPNEKWDGLNTATAPASGKPWTLAPASIAVGDEAYSRAPGAAVLKDFTPFETWHISGRTIAVHRGLDPKQANAHYDGGNLCCSVASNLAADAKTGVLTVAWCDDSDRANGVMVQTVNPVDGTSSGKRSMLAGSATPNEGRARRKCDANHRTAIVARHGGGVFVAAPAGYPKASSVLVWRLGTRNPLVLDRNADEDGLVSLAADRFGRVWVAWYNSGKQSIEIRHSDATGKAFGSPMSLPIPGNTSGIFDLALSPGASGVDVFLFRIGLDATYAFFHTNVS